MLAVPGALLLYATFTGEWSSQANMFGNEVWGPRLTGAFLLLFGVSLTLVAPSEWFRMPGHPRRRRRSLELPAPPVSNPEAPERPTAAGG